MKSSLFLVVFAISALGKLVKQLRVSKRSSKLNSFLESISSEQITTNLNGRTGSRVVGGYTISIKDAPWTVQLRYNNRELCGGSIVSITKILSAAHCTIDHYRPNFSIRAGSSKSGSGGQIRKISKIFEHPQYTSATMANDISILFLTKPLKLSTSVASISIDTSAAALPDGVEVFATGWGLICEGCHSSKVLQAVKLPIVANDRCRKMYKKFDAEELITKSVLCAGLKSGGKDTCQVKLIFLYFWFQVCNVQLSG